MKLHPTISLGLPLFFLSAATISAQEAENTPEEPRLIKTVNLRGGYADLAEQSFDLASVLTGGGGQAKSFYAMLEQVDELAADDSTDTVLFDLSQSVGMNGAQLAEVERCLQKVRESKKVVAYLENAGRIEYSIASQCDQILMADMGGLDFGSMAMTTTYMKDALDLLGVRMDIVRCGDFKGAVEPYVQSEMSAHLRRHYVDMLEHMNADVVRRVADGRGLAFDKVRKLQGKRIFTAKEALLEGLVDRIVPWQGAQASMRDIAGDEELTFKNALRKKKKKSFNFMSFMQDMFKDKKEEEVEEPTLAVLHMSGGIVDGASAQPGSIVSGGAVKTIKSLTENENVQGVVVRINSPGGSATASEAILLALEELAAKKPVVCSMGSVAASGGYYITCFGRPILAESGTITGSIGVFGMKPNMGPLMRRVGINEQTIALDDSANLWSTTRSWNDADKKLMQTSVNEVYDRFLNHVARSREMDRKDVEAIAGGRVWSGDQAVARGLVDKIGGLEMALSMVAAEAGVEDYEIRHLPRPRNFMDSFAEDLLNVRALLKSNVSEFVLQQLGDLQGPMLLLQDAFSERPTRVWAMMPFELRVR